MIRLPILCKLKKGTQLFILSFSDFGIIKHLLDRASPNIRFVVQIEADVGLSFASSNISIDLRNKSNVRLGAVQQVYTIVFSHRNCLSLIRVYLKIVHILFIIKIDRYTFSASVFHEIENILDHTSCNT